MAWVQIILFCAVLLAIESLHLARRRFLGHVEDVIHGHNPDQDDAAVGDG